jgi:hypothetical protein
MVFENKALFVFYSIVNLLLIAFLIMLVVLFFNDIHLFSREIFVLIVAIHMGYFFLVRVHFVAIEKDERAQVIKLQYAKRFTFGWEKRIVAAEIPFKEYDGIELDKKNLNIWQMTIYKKSEGQRYQLGPLKMGWLGTKKWRPFKSNSKQEICSKQPVLHRLGGIRVRVMR